MIFFMLKSCLTRGSFSMNDKIFRWFKFWNLVLRVNLCISVIESMRRQQKPSHITEYSQICKCPIIDQVHKYPIFIILNQCCGHGGQVQGEKEIEVGRVALSNLLGSIGYFYGQSLIAIPPQHQVIISISTPVVFRVVHGVRPCKIL